MRRLFVRTAAAAAVLAAASTAPASAQIPNANFEITPLAGYLWGGGFNTPGGGPSNVPAGKIDLEPSFAWGAEVGYTPNGNTWFELTYLHQSTDATFHPNGNLGCPAIGGATCTAPFSTNYIHAGGRWEFGQKNIKPFLGFGLGITIFDPGQTSTGVNFGSSTDFSISGEAGVIYMLGKGKNQRVGLRGTFRGWWTFVPSGQYSAWCGYYGCYAVETSATVAQGEVTGGLVITF